VLAISPAEAAAMMEWLVVVVFLALDLGAVVGALIWLSERRARAAPERRNRTRRYG